MITYDYNEDTKKYSFEGLSTDSKPTTTEYPDLTNGSSFLEMDTKDVKFYNETGATWV